MKTFGGLGHETGNNRLDFGGDPDHDADPEFLVLISIEIQEFLKDSLQSFLHPIRGVITPSPNFRTTPPGFVS